MSIHNITPINKIVPDRRFWKHTLFLMDPISSDDMIKDLEISFGIGNLNRNCVYDTKWPNDRLKKIAHTSYPLGNLLDSTATVPIDRAWLCYWELYSHSFVGVISDRAIKRIESANEKAQAKAQITKSVGSEAIARVNIHAIPLRSFHMYDIAKSSITSLQKSVNKIEYNVGTQLNWDWLGTYLPDDLLINDIGNNPIKEKSKWTKGVDGDGNVSVANMRAWKNKIDASLKLMDVCVYNDGILSVSDAINAIAFTLLNLNSSGFAYIRLPNMALSSGLMIMIHIFTNCFERSKIVHTVAEDAIFLVGEEFLNNIKPFHKSLYDFCDVTGDSNVVPLTAEYCRSELVTETLALITTSMTSIYDWRIGYYEKVLKINAVLSNSNAARTFENYEDKYVAEQYPDYSDRWVATTEFRFLVRGKEGNQAK